jgi:hypothetical protein
MGPRRAANPVVKRKNIGAPGKLNDYGILHPVGVVVFGELDAKAPGLDSNHGI